MNSCQCGQLVVFVTLFFNRVCLFLANPLIYARIVEVNPLACKQVLKLILEWHTRSRIRIKLTSLSPILRSVDAASSTYTVPSANAS